MNHSSGILSGARGRGRDGGGGGFALHLVHFMTNFELQLQKVAKFFSYFRLQLVKMKSSKKTYPRFLIMFLLFKILAIVIFLFPLKLALK